MKVVGGVRLAPRPLHAPLPSVAPLSPRKGRAGRRPALVGGPLCPSDISPLDFVLFGGGNPVTLPCPWIPAVAGMTRVSRGMGLSGGFGLGSLCFCEGALRFLRGAWAVHERPLRGAFSFLVGVVVVYRAPPFCPPRSPSPWPSPAERERGFPFLSSRPLHPPLTSLRLFAPPYAEAKGAGGSQTRPCRWPPLSFGHFPRERGKPGHPALPLDSGCRRNDEIVAGDGVGWWFWFGGSIFLRRCASLPSRCLGRSRTAPTIGPPSLFTNGPYGSGSPYIVWGVAYI